MATVAHDRCDATHRRAVAELRQHSRRPLTRDERERLRRMVDRARRAHVAWQVDARCVSCGVEMVDEATGEFRYLPGCHTCSDRRAKHRQRATSRARVY